MDFFSLIWHDVFEASVQVDCEVWTVGVKGSAGGVIGEPGSIELNLDIPGWLVTEVVEPGLSLVLLLEISMGLLCLLGKNTESGDAMIEEVSPVSRAKEFAVFITNELSTKLGTFL